MDETIYNIDLLHTSIAENKQIRFLYYEYNLQKKKSYRHNGKIYEASPYALIWDNENYYLLAYDAETNIIKHYRVDKMAKIQLSEHCRIGKDVFDQIDISEYTKRNFSMFGGNQQHVTLRFSNRLIGVVLDRFGKDVIITKDGDEHFCITIPVVVSPQFFGFIFSLGKDAEILQPANVREEMKTILQTILEHY